MSTIVTLPTNPSSGLPTFPASIFSGLKLDVKRIDSFDNTESIAASGRRTAVSWRELPISEFEIEFEFLDNNDATMPQSSDGTIVFTEYDTLRGFFNERHGGLSPFYLRLSDLTHKPSDSLVTGQQIGTGNGTTVNWQLCRTVGTYLEPLQMPDPAGTVAVYVNGVVQTQAAGGDYILLPGGIASFNAPPALNAVITADIPFVYLCSFDGDGEWDQISYLLLECQTLKLKTVIQ